MAKKKQKSPLPRTEAADKPATLKDMLDPQVLAKLKATTESLKANEAERLEKERQERKLCARLNRSGATMILNIYWNIAKWTGKNISDRQRYAVCFFYF